MITISTSYWPELLSFVGYLCLPVFLYAEMHYRLPFFKGALYQRQPEILFDLPYRTETGIIPILFLVKDAHWFRIRIHKLNIRIALKSDNKVFREVPVRLNRFINQKWYHRLFEIDVSDCKDSWLSVDCYAYISIGKRQFVIRNDNYRTLSQKPFNIYVDSEPLPGKDGWLWGDLHTHSLFTEDQVEFGPPLSSFSSMGRALGISFCAITDHSYDLDDKTDSWTDNDSNLHKWKLFLKEIQNLNRTQSRFLLIPGEEVSVDNGFGRTVHMGVLNDPNFHIGTGDGMEKSMGKETEFHYARILDKLPESALAFAAHPFEKPPFSHRLLIHRGIWNRWDLHPRLNGLQILNGKPDSAFENGKKFWISQMSKGHCRNIFGGTDSHGNFNRFRQVNIPLLSMHEHQHQIFGNNLTAVKSTLNHGVDGLIKALKQSDVIISNGPFVSLSKKGNDKIIVHAQSSGFFGELNELTIYRGDQNSRKEVEYFKLVFQKSEMTYTNEFQVKEFQKPFYIRAELTTQKEGFALTNPVRF